jgi:hypothetical protein
VLTPVLTLVLALAAASLMVVSPARAAEPHFGGTVYEKPGESYREAYQRVSRTYGGKLDAIRMFFPGLPRPWSDIRANVDDTPVVVSFRPSPAAVLSGRYDARLAKWFAKAPRNRPTFWSYWHEPEDDGVNAKRYRRAWRHLDRLADRAGNPRLKSTLILMCWTLDPKSGRSWRAYYAGKRSIKVLAFDCYNTGRKNGIYRDPRDILRPVVKVARRVGKPWGIAEFGSTVVASDGGEQGRARWLRRYARYVQNHGGRFATYFDSYVGYDYRLHDRVSRDTWKAIVQR